MHDTVTCVKVYDGVKEREVEIGGVEEERKIMKESLVENVDVCSKRYFGADIKKVSQWWNEEVDEKKKTFWEWLRTGDRETYERCKAINVEIKQMVKEASNRWGWEFGRSFEEKKKA